MEEGSPQPFSHTSFESSLYNSELQGIEIWRGCPSGKDTIALDWDMGVKGLLCSWLYSPGLEFLSC